MESKLCAYLKEVILLWKHWRSFCLRADNRFPNCCVNLRKRFVFCAYRWTRCVSTVSSTGRAETIIQASFLHMQREKKSHFVIAGDGHLVHPILLHSLVRYVKYYAYVSPLLDTLIYSSTCDDNSCKEFIVIMSKILVTDWLPFGWAGI